MVKIIFPDSVSYQYYVVYIHNLAERAINPIHDLNLLIQLQICIFEGQKNYYYLTETRRSVEHCTPHADGAWLNELGWSQ